MNSIVIFEADDQPVEVRLEGETVWLSQLQIAELFNTSTDNISLHLKNIYKDHELEESATTEDFSLVRQEGARQVKRHIRHYNLDAIISVGYRVNSTRATRFRQWATAVLRQHLVEGYTLNQQRLKERGIEFEQALDLLSRTLANQQLVSADGEAGRLHVVRNPDAGILGREILAVASDQQRALTLGAGPDDRIR